jgi:hypothetical protein
MSIVHLKTRKQRIALNKKATEVKKILWTVSFVSVLELWNGVGGGFANHLWPKAQ